MKPLYFQSLSSSADQGKPVAILIHGLFGSRDNLAQLGKSISDAYQVLMVDALNHGLSPRSKDMSYPYQASELLKLIDSLEQSQVTLIGHSMGGKIAMAAALLQPEKVERLVIADMAPVSYPRSHDRVFNALMEIDTQKLSARSQASWQLDQKLTEPGVASFLLKSLYRTDSSWEWRFDLNNLYEQYPAILDWPFKDRVYEKPILFIKGQNSDYLHPRYQQQVLDQFPKASLKIIQDTGHWLHAEKPSLFNRLVLQFLTSTN